VRQLKKAIRYGLSGHAGLAVLCAAISACGGGGDSAPPPPPPPPPPPVTYTIGGTVAGLAEAGLALRNGVERLPIPPTLASFKFASGVVSGATYAVTIDAQPFGQECVVANGSGTATANISNVTVTCTTIPTLSLASIDPPADATGVSRSIAPLLTFSASVDPATVTASSVKLTSVVGEIAVNRDPVGMAVTLKPPGRLFPLTGYDVAVSAALKGAQGQLIAPVSKHFTTQDGAWKPVVVLDNPASVQSSAPSIARNASGSAVAVWTQFDGTRSNLWAGFYDAQTGAWSTPVLAETLDDADVVSPQVALDAAGNAMAVWVHAATGSNALRAVRYTAANRTWGASQVLSPADANAVSRARIALAANGNGIVIWEAAQKTPGSLTHRVYVASYKAAVDSWGSATVLSGADRNAEKPSIAINAAGDSVVIWTGHSTTSGLRDVYVSRYKAQDDVWGAPVSLGGAAGAQDSYVEPQVVINKAGDAVAMWLAVNGQATDDRSLYAARYSASRGTWDGARLVDKGANPVTSFAAGIDFRSDALATWTQSSDGARYDVYYSGYPATGNDWVAPVMLSTLASSGAGARAAAQQVAAAVDEVGNAMVVWRQADSAAYAVWADRYVAQTKSWSPVQQLTTSDRQIRNPMVAVSPSGDISAAWEREVPSVATPGRTRLQVESANFE
jgi:hypothetical protein